KLLYYDSNHFKDLDVLNYKIEVRGSGTTSGNRKLYVELFCDARDGAFLSVGRLQLLYWFIMFKLSK
ncbi:MAG: hypothetical protein JHC31_05790, partial [Sulfurihydrogenibium sp.]|nr:hypothetical protein [Sulfurihydrogenibium sp.]